MRVIETCMSEQRFLSRLEGLCRRKERFDKGYEDKDVFVIEKKGRTFRIGKHYALYGRNHGCIPDCLSGTYTVGQDGFVRVNYRFSRRPMYRFFSAVALLGGCVLWISVLCEYFAHGNYNGNEMAVGGLLWVLAVVGMLLRSGKERAALERHLYHICGCTE